MKQMTKKHNETGRSMVEMLGVLAIMGVLSIGGVAGYRYAVDKMNANEIINELKKRAITASQQRVLSQGINLSEYGAILGKYEVTPANGYPEDPAFFGLEIKAVPQKVCQHIVDSDWAMPAEMKIGNLIMEKGTACPDEFNDMIFAFNNTLSNDTELGNEGETTVTTVTETTTATQTQTQTETTTTTEATETETVTETDTATGTPKEAESGPCAGHGELADIYGGTCLCDAGWSGSWPSYCDENIDRCNGHGLWNGCGCLCDAGWSGGELGYNGDSCTQNIDVCNKNGRFNIYSGSKSCICDPGWSGDDCSSGSDSIISTVTEMDSISDPEESVSRICGEQQIQGKYGNCYDCSYETDKYGVTIDNEQECSKCDGSGYVWTLYYKGYNRESASKYCVRCDLAGVFSDFEDNVEASCRKCGLGVNWATPGIPSGVYSCAPTSQNIGTKPNS